MSKLTQVIKDQCCAALMGHDQKQQVLREIELLEKQLATRNKELEDAALELNAVKEAVLTKAEEVFYHVYQGDNPKQAWLQLSVELGLELGL